MRDASIDLPEPGRTDHQQVVVAGGGDFEGPLGRFLTFDVAKIGSVGLRRKNVRLRPRQRLHALEVIDERQEMRRREDVDVFARPGRFGTGRLRADEALAHRVGADGGRQRAGNGADRTVERQFTDGGVGRDGVGRDGLHRRHHRQHDREIEMAAFLRQVGRREIDGDVLKGQAKADRVQGVADALAAFGDRLVGQADDGERCGARRDANLDLDGARLDTDKRERGDLAVHAPPDIGRLN